MTQAQPTQNTNDDTSNNSQEKKRKGRPPLSKVSEEDKALATVEIELNKLDQVLNGDTVAKMTATEIGTYQVDAKSLADFEAQIQLAKHKGLKWLEVPKELLTLIHGGTYPETHYMVYKDIKVAAENKAEECQRLENQNVSEIVFPKDAKLIHGTK